MKKQLIFVIVILLVSFLTENKGALASVKSGRMVVISRDKEDITGDGKKELIVLTGVDLKNDQYNHVAITVTDSHHTNEKINLPKGYHPYLQLMDFDQDGVKDLYASISNNKLGLKSQQSIYTFKNIKPLDMGLPVALMLESCFLNGYKAQIKIRNTGNNHIFDLSGRKNYYEKLGVFHKGRLNEPTELMVTDFRNLMPVQIGDKIGLKGIQKVAGVSDSDTIGYVESTWLYDQSEWKLINIIVLKSS